MVEREIDREGVQEEEVNWSRLELALHESIL